MKQETGRLPHARAEGLVVQELTDETLIYNLETHRAHCLNRTAYLVWKNCDGTRDFHAIAKILERELSASVNIELVWFAIEQLSKDGLLRERVKIPSSMRGISRRLMMKRIGTAAIVAVPVVTSLLAPTAAQASTGCVNCNGTICCPPQTCIGGVCR